MNENPPAYAPIATATAASSSSYAPIVVQQNASVANYGANKQTEQDVTYIPDAYVVGPTTVSPPAHTTPAVTSSNTTSNPPGNCPNGGQWGTLQYAGNKTCALTCLGCIICGIFGLAFLACPQDEKDAYCINGKLYDAAGVYISRTTNLFIPSKRRWRFPRAGDRINKVWYKEDYEKSRTLVSTCCVVHYLSPTKAESKMEYELYGRLVHYHVYCM